MTRLLAALLLTLTTRAFGAPCVAPADLGIDPATEARCDPLVPERCLLPFPNDYYTVADGNTPTRRRLNLDPYSTPKNKAGTPMNTEELNRFDGFSPGVALLLWMPTVDLVRSDVPSLTNLGRSLEDDSPVVVVDADSGKRWPVWVELDVNSAPANRALIIRPVTNFLERHRYVVGVRRLVDGTGAALPASAPFAAYRDRTCTTDSTFEARRDHMESVFRALSRAGVQRDDLQLAWDFTIASHQAIAGRLLRMRDDAFRSLRGRAPKFTVTAAIDHPNAETRRRVMGTYEVPLYMTGGGAPGERLALDAEGRPVRQPDPFVATFTCNLPQHDPASPARTSLYGHGLLGDQGEVNGSLTRTMSATYNVAYCATDWIGMAEEDVSNAVDVLEDLSKFPTLADRLQQGILNNLILGRLVRDPDGFASDPAFQLDGKPLIDTSQLYYDGNSQGAILGGAFCAVARDLRRCVLGEAGMNYSTLLQRSVDFDLYKIFLDDAYPDTYVQLVSLEFIQMLWDRGETNGYAEHLTANPYRRTPHHTVLLLGAVGDHQVTEFALQVEARTMVAAGHVPYVAPDRDRGEHGFGITPIPHYPWPGSAYFLFDTGSPLSPLEAMPPRAGHDPHDDTPKIPAAMALKDAFFHPDGAVPDACAGAPCTGPQF